MKRKEEDAGEKVTIKNMEIKKRVKQFRQRLMKRCRTLKKKKTCNMTKRTSKKNMKLEKDIKSKERVIEKEKRGGRGTGKER